jgi:hypothetical protein
MDARIKSGHDECKCVGHFAGSLGFSIPAFRSSHISASTGPEIAGAHGFALRVCVR